MPLELRGKSATKMIRSGILVGGEAAFRKAEHVLDVRGHACLCHDRGGDPLAKMRVADAEDANFMDRRMCAQDCFHLCRIMSRHRE